MASTNFVTDVTVIEAAWLNDVNSYTYNPVSVKPDFIADNVTDNLAIFNSAIANLVSIGGGKIEVGKYDNIIYTSAAIEIPSNITIEIDSSQVLRTDTSIGFGATTYPDTSDKNCVFIFNGSLNQSITTTLTALTAIDDTTITVASTTGFSVGQDIWIADDNISDGGFHYQREWNRIIDITGSVITLEMPLNFAYAATDTDVWLISPCENSHITGGLFDQSADIVNATHGIGGQFSKNCSITKSKGRNLRGKLVSIWNSYGLVTTDSNCKDAQVATSGLGYGVQYLMCRHSSIVRGVYSNLRHATDFAGGSDLLVDGAHSVWMADTAVDGPGAYSLGHGYRTRRQRLKNSFASNWARGATIGNPTFDGDYHISVSGNTISNCEIGIYALQNSANIDTFDNDIINSTTIAIGYQDITSGSIHDNRLDGVTGATQGTVNIFTSTDINVHDNGIDNSGLRAINAASCVNLILNDNEIHRSTQEDIYVTGQTGTLVINGNTIECTAGAYDSIYVVGLTGAGQIPRLDAKNNTILGDATNTTGIRAAYVSQAVINNNTIENVIEGIRCEFGDAPQFVSNYIENTTNGIRLIDDVTDVMTTYYSSSNVITNASGSQILNSASAAVGTLV